MRALRNAYGPAGTQIVVGFDWFQIVVENLIAIVGPVGDPDVALSIDLQSMRQTELTGLTACPFAAGLRKKSAVLIKLDDAIVAIAVADEDVPLRIPSDIRRPAENVFLRRRIRARSGSYGSFHCRRPAAENHQDSAFRTKLRDDVRAFIDRPDIVLRIDAHRMREFKTIVAFADLFDEDAILVEFPQTRVCTTEIDEDVSLRVCCDTDSFAESFPWRRLQEIRHRRVGDLRYVLNRGFLLR